MNLAELQFPRLLLPEIENLHQLDVYLANGGYEMYRKVLTMPPADVIEEVKRSGLRGRGGAGFPTGLKWSFMPKGNEKPKYLAVNGDESEPGSFKDREIFERNPHLLIEGILISCYAMGVTKAYVYIRGEYHRWIRLLQRALDDAYAAGLVGDRMPETHGGTYAVDIVVHKGAGAYICGEESSLMNSIEGDRPYPRVKPPFPAQVGLWGMPTTVNNVETIANVPAIVRLGGAEYAKIGAEKHTGTLLFGISGHVNKPGVYELPTGLPLVDIIEQVAGGVPGGKKIKAVIPGGSSMPILRGDQLDGVLMDAESLKAAGSAIGTGGIIVMDEDTDIPHMLKRLIHFYHHESCGQCTPCREGCGWLEKILERIDSGEGTPEDLDLLIDIANNIEGNTVCALGDAAAWPTRYTVQRFREDFEARVKRDTILPVLNVVHSLRRSRDEDEPQPATH